MLDVDLAAPVAQRHSRDVVALDQVEQTHCSRSAHVHLDLAVIKRVFFLLIRVRAVVDPVLLKVSVEVRHLHVADAVLEWGEFVPLGSGLVTTLHCLAERRL